VVEDDAPDVLVVGRGPRHVTLVVTRGLVDQLSRVELEGVLAHEISIVRFGDVEPATVAVAALAPWRILVGSPPTPRPKIAPARSDMLADLRAVSLTRYPPGLISAFEKIGDAPARRAGRRAERACEGLWLRAGGEGAMAEQIEALREL
jgi:heat shock protein HtpX